MKPIIPSVRIVEKAGVRAAQNLFESCGCVFQEVAQQNDYGKDAYIDLSEGSSLSPVCVAIQIKSGNSYRTASGDYFIPLDRHASSWRDSTVPVFGVVYDPEDEKLRWIDLTGHLRKNTNKNSGRIPVPREAILSESTLTREFRRAAYVYTSGGVGSIVLKLIDKNSQEEAVLDAWALGRGDARFLILLRRLILHLGTNATREAIWVLSHATPHPDIFWTKENWIPEVIQHEIRRTFRWSAEEIRHLFLAVGQEEWGRGTLGQSVHMLLSQDFYFGENFNAALRDMVSNSECNYAIGLIWVALYAAEDPQRELESILKVHPELRAQASIVEVLAHLKEFNEFDFY